MMYKSIEKFGANVLNYLISNSEDGDTILYAIMSVESMQNIFPFKTENLHKFRLNRGFQ